MSADVSWAYGVLHTSCQKVLYRAREWILRRESVIDRCEYSLMHVGTGVTRCSPNTRPLILRARRWMAYRSWSTLPK